MTEDEQKLWDAVVVTALSGLIAKSSGPNHREAAHWAHDDAIKCANWTIDERRARQKRDADTIAQTGGAQ